MELLKDLGIKYYEAGRQNVTFGLFKCPVCFKEYERPKRLGLMAKMCKICNSRKNGKMLKKYGAESTTEGVTKKLYKMWWGMKERCYKKYNRNYKYYGAKGIKICDEWQDFHNFQKWALNNGYTYSENKKRAEVLSIDRINPDLDYMPSNCQFISVGKNSVKDKKIIFTKDFIKSIIDEKEKTGKPLKYILSSYGYSYPRFIAVKNRLIQEGNLWK